VFSVKLTEYKTIILPVVLYGCETWFLTVREVHRLRVFENRVPSRIFGLEREKVAGDRRRLHNAELHNLHASPIIIIIVVVIIIIIIIIIISLAPQPSLGLGLLHKILLNFLEASQQFSFLQGRVVSPRPIPIPLYLYPTEVGWLPILVTSYDTHGLLLG
jgi:hypothetical protein